MSFIDSLLLEKRIPYVIIVIIFFIAGSLPIFFLDNEFIVLSLNGSHKPWLDLAACTITQFGSLWFYILFLGLVVFFGKNIKQALLAGVSFFNTCIVVQVLKHVVFDSSPRPIDVIATQKLHLIEGFPHEHLNSFPSGHASTVFVTAVVLSLLCKNQKIFFPIVIFLFSTMVAISRIYLAMHFYHDVYAGALIGTVCTLGTHYALSVIQLPTWVADNFSRIIRNF